MVLTNTFGISTTMYLSTVAQKYNLLGAEKNLIK